MLDSFDKFSRALFARVPGTTINVAQAKRKMERELRARGHSRKEAMTLTAERFANPLKGKQ